jgi:hypothetical protein
MIDATFGQVGLGEHLLVIEFLQLPVCVCAYAFMYKNRTKEKNVKKDKVEVRITGERSINRSIEILQ